MPSINEPAALVNAAVSCVTKLRWPVIPVHTVRTGRCGDESLADLERQHGPLPDTSRSLADELAPSPEPIAPPSADDEIPSDPPSSWAAGGPGR
jgi:hypothetical protein